MNRVQKLLDEWQAVRAEIRAAEAAEHPDIADRFGRVWVWKQGDLYVHDQLAWTSELIARCTKLPSKRLADNPNYRLCGICTQDWTKEDDQDEDQVRRAQVLAGRAVRHRPGRGHL